MAHLLPIKENLTQQVSGSHEGENEFDKRRWLLPLLGILALSENPGPGKYLHLIIHDQGMVPMVSLR